MGDDIGDPSSSPTSGGADPESRQSPCGEGGVQARGGGGAGGALISSYAGGPRERPAISLRTWERLLLSPFA